MRERSPATSRSHDSRAPCAPRAKVQSSDKDRTRAGAVNASCCAMTPPIECPTTSKEVAPTASATARASAAMVSMDRGAEPSELLPIPRLSKAIAVWSDGEGLDLWPPGAADGPDALEQKHRRARRPLVV